MQSERLRQEKGETIAKAEGSIQRIDEGEYQVRSQSGNGFYQVLSTEYGWACSCPDNQYRGIDCKHILAVRFSLAIRKVVEVHKIEPITNPSACVYCGSENVAKDGLRHNKSRDIQVFNCKACGRYFTINLGFEKMHATPQIITSAMQLYFTGESLRNVQKFLRLQGVNVSHVCILKWIRKYVKLMDAHLSKITPQVSDTWRADELYVKVKGDMKYLFAVMDDETRFWIAQQVSNVKEGAYASRLFMEAKRVADKSPTFLITDALRSYAMAAKLDFPNAKHIREIAIDGKIHNNKMERMNGEVRDREKVMRGLKNTDSPILKGYQIFHNYIREHEGLDGKTPAEAAGIQVEDVNKWLTIIQNASKPTTVNREK